MEDVSYRPLVLDTVAGRLQLKAAYGYCAAQDSCASDNWLRCWFIGVDATSVALTVPKKLPEWQKALTAGFLELHRILRPGGHVAFEVGEVRGGKIKLEEAVLPCGASAGFEPLLVLINDQKFTKTANCWGVDNNSKGANTNRVVVLQKPQE